MLTRGTDRYAEMAHEEMLAKVGARELGMTAGVLFPNQGHVFKDEHPLSFYLERAAKRAKRRKKGRAA